VSFLTTSQIFVVDATMALYRFVMQGVLDSWPSDRWLVWLVKRILVFSLTNSQVLLLSISECSCVALSSFVSWKPGRVTGGRYAL
jgi:hypothetical protein